MHGNLGQKRLADVIRDIGQKNASGLLRLTSGKTIKAIFFESGDPVFAISNVAGDQLEQVILREGLATPDLVDQAKQRAAKPQRLGQTMVEMGVLAQDALERVSRQSATQIILSLFEWTQGEFVFDERMRAVHEVTLGWSAYDCILEGARHAARIGHIVQAVAPDHGVLEKLVSNGSRLGFTGKLSPMESYVLSRIESSTQVSDLGAITGLSDQESREAACALISAGLLRVGGVETAAETDEEREDTADLIAEDVSRKMHFFAKADFYEILGVTRRSNSVEIKTAYYKLAKKYHPDRYRHPDHKDLRARLEALFSKISEAYDTLSDGGKRAAYDELTKHSAKLETPARLDPVPRVEARVETPVKQEPVHERPSVESAAAAAAAEPRETDADVSSPAARPQAAAASARPLDEANPIQTTKGPAPSPSQMAEYYHQQGRARTEQKDYYGAVQLLREAVKLDGSRPHYHYHLGVALLKNPRTRREGEHHLVKAAELDPFNAQIRVRLGMLYKEAGLPKKADYYFKAALAIDPENRVALRELAGGSSSDKKENIWKSDLGSIAKKIFKK